MQSKVPSEHMSCAFQRAYHILQWDLWAQSSHRHLHQHIDRKQQQGLQEKTTNKAHYLRLPKKHT
jgi:hypothetical protein